jgi:alpha-tubulin suppressor-like RCC1 family protein
MKTKRSKTRLILALLLGAGLVLSGCGKEKGEKGESGAAGTSSGGSSSLAYMTGTPATTGTQGTAYSFTPTIVNTANDNLSFSMLNQPSWMSIDNSTGVISGAPTADVVGTTATNLLYMLKGTQHIYAPAPFSLTVAAPEITATSISGGTTSSHVCAIDNSSGKVKCWGRNSSGQLGLGHVNNLGDASGEMGSNLAYIDLGTGRTATAISAGNGHTCALLDNSVLKCWGYNNKGQLGLGHSNNIGDGSGEMGDNLASIDLGSGRTATAITTGESHTCALLDNASIKCWGQNTYGQLGLGHTNNLGDDSSEMGDNLAAVELGSGRTASAITAGGYHTCALLDNASVKCWGYNDAGHLGLGHSNNIGDGSGEMGDNLAAVDLGTGRTATAIMAGESHTCALLDNASVKCWGSNYAGGLGQGSSSHLGDGSGEMGDNLAAVDLGTGRTATAITAGTSHTCVLLDNGAVKCWGINNRGQLGQGSTSSLGDGSGEMGDNLAAIDLGTGRTATAIISGGNHVCALLDNSALKCWGYNFNGQLGQGSGSDLGDGSGEMGDNLTAIDL